jgi:N-methylhydantoinase A
MSVIVGVDVGGTFTDFYLRDAVSGRIDVYKTSSTPANPADAILAGLEAIIAAGYAARDSIQRISHGTTVATNALLQRTGAPVALVVTEGFRDLLEIGRQTRPHLYSLQIDAPEPLISRERRFEAPERIGADGRALRTLDETAIADLVQRVRDSGCEAVAVCLLFSFMNPEHERRLRDALEAAGCDFVSISSDVQPEFREFERMSTTVLNAYLQPLMAGYLSSLERAKGKSARNATLRINQSSGGLMSASQAAKFPIRTALSGPAAGAVGAAYVARTANRNNVITLDMGGTSADVCLIRDMKFSISYEGSVGGFPIRLPMADVNAVGAGGGSIAWLDRDGLMKVGPRSAGARPGPACYGTGGDLPTVTDANLLLGRLSPAGLLEGELPLRADRAEAVFRELAERIDKSVIATAQGCIDIVVSNMVRAIRTISVEKGHDPAYFSLLAFGGGGPLHARAVAASLGIREIIVPLHPGILCAQGLLAADISESFVTTRRLRITPLAYPGIAEALHSLIERAQEWYSAEHAPAEGRSIDATLDMRYVGQNYELSISIDYAAFTSSPAEAAIESLQKAFAAVHQTQYGTTDPLAAIEVVNDRVTARVKHTDLHSHVRATSAAVSAPAPRSYRAVYFADADPVHCPVYSRRDLRPGMTLQGPSIIDQLDTTTVLFPGDRLTVDGADNLLIEVAA